MAMHLWAVAEGAAAKRGVAARSDAVGYAAGLVGWMLAGSVFVAVKLASDEMPPWILCSSRSFVSALALVPFATGHWHQMATFLRKRWLEAAFIGAMGLGITQGVMFTSLYLTSAVNTGIVFALAPMITLVGAHFVLHEGMNKWQGIGSAVAFCGVVVIAVQGSFSRLIGLQIGLGDLVALGATVLFAGYTVLLKRAKFELPPIPLLIIMLFAGSLGSLPFALWEVWNGEHSHLAAKGYLALLYCGVIGGSLLYLLYNWSIEVLGASRAGTLVYTQPIFVAVFAWLILSESIEWYHYVGAALVAIGVLFVVLLRPKSTFKAA
jgi:drug/metabolite transporter (DMT)-like permease